MENEQVRVTEMGSDDIAIGEMRQSGGKSLVKRAMIPLIIAVIIVIAFLGKRYFVAATVDGTSISRLSVIKQLEKENGKQVLDAMIVETLIANEAKKNKAVPSSDDIAKEITKIETQISAQGITLEEALSKQGMTMDDLKKQLITKLEAEKLVMGETQVTDEEVQKYIVDNKVKLPKGGEDATKAQIKDQLSQQKVSTAAQALLAKLKTQAKIKYYVTY